ncbi:MAG: hypothetical protein PHE09_11060 [Oscillospiraceae bacterium]|nr:hypothetical protein [Oscillospiraceae bacterium]
MAGNQKITVDREAYPSNSKRVKEEASEKVEKKPEVQKIVTGRVRKQKKSFFKRIGQTMFGDDSRSVGTYVLQDILIPAAKDLVVDTIRGGIEVAVYGERQSRNSRRGYTHYDKVSYRAGDRDRDREKDRREVSRSARARHDFDDIVLDSRGEAEDVRIHLLDLCDEYGQATVADFYDLVGVTSSFTDNKYGWTDLRGASVSRVRDGYLINLPRTELLD